MDSESNSICESLRQPPSLDSLQSFTYQDVVQNLKSIEPLYEDNDWNGNDTIRVPVLDFKDFFKVSFSKRLLAKGRPRVGLCDWSHGPSNLHVLEPITSQRGTLYCRKATF
ncbi:hypothetical protein TNIN_259341 [Trichonephila inaurata madagascariensis]|uniref:Uncharacterized protein n=1 Tax=Trichonephila inaurata madagascariensis TaxID=2747483 RepID=A0A8X6XNR6_9ARAC|nr:hypothetical protein TNIN_259341 [Trichonephila inaurata madagascariensis]